jgi:hypothetical protein
MSHVYGDTDDLWITAMLLGWPGLELAGVTTSSGEGGMRAGLVSYALRLAGRWDVCAAAGGRRDPRRPEQDHLAPNHSVRCIARTCENRIFTHFANKGKRKSRSITPRPSLIEKELDSTARGNIGNRPVESLYVGIFVLSYSRGEVRAERQMGEGVVAGEGLPRQKGELGALQGHRRGRKRLLRPAHAPMC